MECIADIFNRLDTNNLRWDDAESTHAHYDRRDSHGLMVAGNPNPIDMLTFPSFLSWTYLASMEVKIQLASYADLSSFFQNARDSP